MDSIRENNFYESKGDIWAGPGVYFFVDGINDLPTIECALQWAIDQHAHTPTEPRQTDCIAIEAIIAINDNKYLDLTKDEGLKLFNDFRRLAINKLESAYTAKAKYNDVDVLRVMREELKIELIKAHVYIQLGFQRKMSMFSRFPNVTIFVVNNPTSHILKPTIKEVARRKIQ